MSEMFDAEELLGDYTERFSEMKRYLASLPKAILCTRAELEQSLAALFTPNGMERKASILSREEFEQALTDSLSEILARSGRKIINVQWVKAEVKSMIERVWWLSSPT